MSLCISIFNTKGELYMAADSRESVDIKGITHVKNNNFEKIKCIHDKLIFGSGNSQLIKNIWYTFENQPDSSLEKLKKIAVEHNNYFTNFLGEKELKRNYLVDGKIMTCCLTIGVIDENGKPYIAYMDNMSDFKIQKHSPTMGLCQQLYVTGAKTKEARDFLMSMADNPNHELKDLFTKTYEYCADESIGGYLSIYCLYQNEIRRVLIEKIRDTKSLRYQENQYFYDLVNSHFVLAGHLEACTGTFVGKMEAGEVIGSKIKGGTLNINNNCIIDSNGYLTATGATITGKINATSGEISGDLDITGSLNGGYINGSTISTTQDINVGNNIYLNATTYDGKMIKFNPATFINYAGLIGMNVECDKDIKMYSGGSLNLQAYNNINFVSYNGGYVKLPYESYLGVVADSNQIIRKADLSNYLTSDDVYSKSYIDNNFASASHNHDSRYIRPYYTSNKCYIDYSESLNKLIIRNKNGDDVGQVDITAV